MHGNSEGSGCSNKAEAGWSETAEATQHSTTPWSPSSLSTIRIFPVLSMLNWNPESITRILHRTSRESEKERERGGGRGRERERGREEEGEDACIIAAQHQLQQQQQRYKSGKASFKSNSQYYFGEKLQRYWIFRESISSLQIIQRVDSAPSGVDSAPATQPVRLNRVTPLKDL